jgi:hypothetical protein
VYLLAGAFAAFVWGYVFDSIGRRGGLTAGLSLGVIGSGIAFYAIAIQSFAIFLIGMVLMGIANAAVQLGRFAAAEVNRPEHRGRAISNVVIGGTVGSGWALRCGSAGSIIHGDNELAGVSRQPGFVQLRQSLCFGYAPTARDRQRGGEKFPEKWPLGVVRTCSISSTCRDGRSHQHGAGANGHGPGDGHHVAAHARPQPHLGDISL